MYMFMTKTSQNRCCVGPKLKMRYQSTYFDNGL